MENRAEWGKEEFEEDKKEREKEKKKDIKKNYDNHVKCDKMDIVTKNYIKPQLRGTAGCRPLGIKSLMKD